MEDKLFQRIFDILEPVLPGHWKRLVFFAGYIEGSYTMKYYVKDDNDEYTDCFRQNVIGNAQLIKVFMNIDKIIKVGRDKLDDKSKWSVMTMIVDADGNMKTEFDYSDISEDSIGYEQNWRKKYIH